MNERQRRFAEAYAADPNATEAAKAAGYSEKTARAQGARLLTNVDVLKYVRQLQSEAAAGRIASMAQVQAFWSDTMNDPAERTADRLKASELLAKAGGVFVRIRDDMDGRTVEAWRNDGVTIVLPPIKSEESCEWHEDDPPEGWEVID